MNYVLALMELIPRGAAWPRETGEAPAFDELIAGLAIEPGRVGDRAAALLTEALPTDTTELLAEWEELAGLPDAFSVDSPTVAQRRAALLAKLRGRGEVSIPELQETLRTLFGVTDLTITHREIRPYACNIAACGDEVGQDWRFVWMCRYIDNVLNVDPDDFAAWDFAAATNNQAQSPVTEVVSAASVNASDSDSVETTLTLAGGTFRAGLWARPKNDGNATTITLQLQQNDTTVLATEVYELGDNAVWQYLEIEATDVTDTDPRLVYTVGSGGGAYLSYAQAGEADPANESRAALLAPIHTTPHFGFKP